jgi:hypothetical protein
MDAALREQIDHSKFHQCAVREIAALLPPTDEALSAQIAETIAVGDQLGFLFLVTAALDAGRRVGAEHLVGGTALSGDTNRLGNFAWRMEGDVPGAIMAAMQRGVLARETHAGALFVVVAWCQERRGGEIPREFAAEARHLARLKNLRNTVLVFLGAAALKANDEGFLAVLRQNYPEMAQAPVIDATEKLAAACLTVFAGPVMDCVPAAPPKTLAQGRTMRRAAEKLGRNDQCHCGSGKKYKHCCFGKDEERLHFSTEVAGKTHAELRTEPEAGLTESRIKSLPRFELARIDPRKVPEALRRCYITQVFGLQLFERMAEYFEVTDWNEERKQEWDFSIFFVMRKQRKDIAERMVAVRVRHEPDPDLRDGIRLLLVRDDPAEELRVLAETALGILRETDPQELEKLGYGILCSRHTELGILVCRSLLPLLPRREATFLLGEILEARDRLNLPPDDPFSDILEQRLAEETHDEGKDATALRAARKRLDAKAAEVRDLTERIARQRRELERLEKKQHAGPQPAPHTPADDAELREMRIKLDGLKGTLHERSAERITLRRELEKARDDLETLRHGNPPPTPAGDTAGDDEDAHYLPEQPAGNQPLRLVEFPHKFRETLEELPRQAARAALAMIGRLAGGEPAAFVGVVQLKACHGILRQRIGSEHRLLFRLHPDRVQILDLINRRDLHRKIKTLRAAG